MFAALLGTRTDGARYIPTVYKKGCVAVLTENADGLDGYYIKVPNVRAAYARMCADLYCDVRDKIHCVGITGTNGKTTVGYMLRHIFEKNGVRCGLIGSIANITPKRCTLSTFTTPDPPDLYKILNDNYTDGAEYVFMETSSHALALDKVSAITFDVGVLTNITSDHMDFHKNRDNYIRAKTKLFAQSKKTLYNADCAEWEDVSRCVGTPYKTYSSRYENADFLFKTVSHTAFDMKVQCNGVSMHINSPAEFNAYNATAAVGCACMCGIDIKDACGSLCDFEIPSGRCQIVSPPDANITVIIDFSHTPDSLENILLCAEKIAKRRVILVFGCGGDRDKTKRPEMGRIASRYADYIIVTSDNSRGEDPEDIINDIMVGVDKNSRYEKITDRQEAIINALQTARDGDCIVLAGKGHEEYEINKDGKRYFSEREIVRGWFERRH